MHLDIPQLRSMGIIFDGATEYRDPVAESRWGSANFAMDAAPPNALQQQLVTAPNAGIPAYLTNYLDPELVRVLTAPVRAEEIYGVTKKGDWSTATVQFPIIESAGDVSSYGDYNNNGSVTANANWEPRENYTFQTITRWGDLELERAGLAKLDWAAEMNLAAAKQFNIALNKSYFLGVANLDNYGFLNDPSLNASITPGLTGTGSSPLWSTKTGLNIWADIQALWKQLQVQTQGLVSNRDSFKLCMSQNLEPFTLSAMQNVYGNSTVEDMFKKAFPNATIEAAPEYATSAGEIIQIVVADVQGQKMGFCAFTERMRAHAIVRDTSSTYQKKSAGTLGGVLKFPAAIATGIGY